MIIISDIHSRYPILQQIIDRYQDKETLVFLGDIFDYRQDVGQLFDAEVQTGYMFSYILDNLKVKWIRGNHDYNVFESSSPPVKSMKTRCDLVRANLFDNLLKHYKESIPFFKFKEDGITWEIAHAYPYSHAPLRDQIFGIKVDNRRFKWWEICIPQTDIIKVCGHYHRYETTNNCIVIDGDCKKLQSIFCLDTALYNISEFKYKF